MGRRLCPKGMEVPVIDSDAIKWIELSVPSTSGSTATFTPALPAPPQASATPPTDVASYSIIGNPPTYLIWRIEKSQSHVLEVVEHCAHKEIPRIGLRIIFSDVLCPFAFICKDEIHHSSWSPYMLYTLTVSGVAYLIRLKSFNDYASSSVFSHNEIIECNTHVYINRGSSVAVAATAGCIVIGKNDGSVSCFQLGILDPFVAGFAYELRDDAGLGRLWGIVSRSKAVAEVKDLVISEVHGKKLLFALHSDGALRVWNLLNHSRIFSHTINNLTLTGATFVKLWISESSSETSMIALAILCKHNMEARMDVISTCCFSFNPGERIIKLLDSVQNIPLEEGELIDVKVSSKDLWLLKEDKLIVYQLCDYPDNKEGMAHCYFLQETFITEQLFQNSSDDLWLVHSLISSPKEIARFVSSIFLRRLFCPGVYHNMILQATLQDFNRHLTDSEFHSLTVDGLKQEILTLIEHEGVSENPVSIIHCWRNFCTCYIHNWCKHSAACGLLVDSSAGAIGLIRKNSISLFRHLEDVELLTSGSLDEIGDNVISGLDFSDKVLDGVILVEVLQCINDINQQLGKAASAIFYESLISAPRLSSEEVISQLLKSLETGYCPSTVALQVSELGADVAWEKEMVNHKNLRKFSMEMFSSLHALLSRAITWGKVLNIIECYFKFLVPRKITHKMDSEAVFDVNTSVAVHATSQVAKAMFESALDILQFLSYLARISGQICMSHSDVSRIQLELVPMIQEIITEWHIIHFLGSTPSECPAIEDFSSMLSSLKIDGNTVRGSWNEKLGKCDFTLAFVLLLNIPSFSGDKNHCSLKYLPDPSYILGSVREFTSWIMWGRSGEESSFFFRHSIELAIILLKHGQYDSVEYLITTVDAHSRKEKTSQSLQSIDGEWCILLHLLGCCLVAQAHHRSHGNLRERKISEAVCYFFRAASMQGATQALQSLSYETGLPHLGFTGCGSAAAWKLHYYQWAMQIFEKYNMSEAACQFASAALEQVDEAFGSRDDGLVADPLHESAITVKGRLWANIFKFELDLCYYYDAYCAIISNPDEESKNLCLRRFIIVLYERGAVKILCDSRLPFIGLVEKVERELVWKAERSDVSVRPNPFKLLYAFEMHKQNWRQAASYIYLYSSQLKSEAGLKDHQRRSLALQERLNGLSAAINALHLVHPAYAWIDLLPEEVSQREHYPSKKARITAVEQSVGDDNTPQRPQTSVDIEKLENEYVFTSAELLLSLANVKWSFTGNEKPQSELVDLLVESSLYDMVFTVILKIFKGSGMKRELERVFSALSLKCCCPSKVSLSVGIDDKKHGLLLTSSEDEVVVHGSLDMGHPTQQAKGSTQWETLKLYLEKYRGFHPRLPAIVAETLLSADPKIELPLWLVHMFKSAPRAIGLGMTGNELDPASLFRLYVDYGRYAEATNLLLDYFESIALLRPTDIIRKKRPSAMWFPYTLIERLWCQLEELIRVGHKVDQCKKLKKLLHGALLTHLNTLKVDSNDVQSSAAH